MGKTTGQIVKAVRALRLHVKKRGAFATNQLFGVSLRPFTMAFLLNRFPKDKTALKLTLPHPVPHACEGLFLKTTKGKKVLTVQFGGGDLETDALVKNASVVLCIVRKSLDLSLLHEVTVDADGLALPVWNRKLWDKAKPRARSCTLIDDSKRARMPAPAVPPPKKRRLI